MYFVAKEYRAFLFWEHKTELVVLYFFGGPDS